jgi:tetratricopeptide (TPR) repeat protein
MSEPEETPPDLDEELREAALFLEENDPVSALMRAARALAVAPESAEALAMAGRVLAVMPDALEHLAIEDEGVSFGIVAMRARAMAVKHRFIDAADLALQVAAFRPKLAYAPWAVAALKGLDRELEPAEADRLLRRVSPLFEALTATDLSAPAARANANAACDVLARIRETTTAKLEASFLRSGLLRRLGRTRDAVEEATRAFAETPCWISAAELGLAHRDNRELDLAMKWFRRATELDPADETAWVDMGDILSAQELWPEAVEAYEQSLSRKTRHAPALVGVSYARWRGGDDEARGELEALASRTDAAGELARQRLAAGDDAQTKRSRS